MSSVTVKRFQLVLDKRISIVQGRFYSFSVLSIAIGISRNTSCIILIGQVPQGAVQGGYQDGGPLFIARGKNPAGEPTPGKLHPPHGFFLSWGGKEHHPLEYEVLVCDGISDVLHTGARCLPDKHLS